MLRKRLLLLPRSEPVEIQQKEQFTNSTLWYLLLLRIILYGMLNETAPRLRCLSCSRRAPSVGKCAEPRVEGLL